MNLDLYDNASVTAKQPVQSYNTVEINTFSAFENNNLEDTNKNTNVKPNFIQSDYNNLDFLAYSDLSNNFTSNEQTNKKAETLEKQDLNFDMLYSNTTKKNNLKVHDNLNIDLTSQIDSNIIDPFSINNPEQQQRENKIKNIEDLINNPTYLEPVKEPEIQKEDPFKSLWGNFK